MASGVFDDALIKHLWSTEELRAIFSDANRVQKWYDFEAALALEQAELGIIPRAAAQDIAAKAKVGNVDIEAIAAEIRRIKHPLVPALKAVEKLCQDGHGEYIHFGPTTQDVLDTGTMLQIKDAHAIYLRDMKAIGQALYQLADAHKATPMAGRSHGVQALPITFGHKAAIWLSEMGRNYQRLTQLEPRMFVGGMVGAVGTQASYGPQAPELERRLMKRLGLGVADINWQPARDRFAEYVCVLAIIGQTLGKIANEIINLEHTEIGELFEPFSEGKVGSSTMPHKRNPSSCEAAVGVSRALRYNATYMLECMIIEHERDGSAWRGEWKAHTRVLPDGGRAAGDDEIRAVRADRRRAADAQQPRPAGRLPALRARHVRALGEGRQADRARPGVRGVDARHRARHQLRAGADAERARRGGADGGGIAQAARSHDLRRPRAADRGQGAGADAQASGWLD